MTVDYMTSVATASRVGCFWRVLWRWKGSVYKLLFFDLLVYLSIYYTVWMVYRHFLNDEQKLEFEAVVKYCKQYVNSFPISFVLGFFVSTIMTRWWNQYQTIPSPTALSVYVSSSLHGEDEVARAMRRTIVRYAVVSITIVFRKLAPRVKKRFPKFSDYVIAGLLNDNEVVIIEDLAKTYPGIAIYWLPLVWAATIAGKARQIGKIRYDHAVQTIIDELNSLRGKLGTLSSYNSVSIPLVYTQVVTIAVYSFFVTALLANADVSSWKDHDKEVIGLTFGYFPVFVILQFIFYMGWLKVAEQLMNPFGDDEDDFQLNPMIDKNLQMAYLIVDDMYAEHPTILKDMYWSEIPTELPDKGKRDARRDSSASYTSFHSPPPRRQSLLRRQSLGVQKVKINAVPTTIKQEKAEKELAIDPALIPRLSDISTDVTTESEEIEYSGEHNRDDRKHNRISTISGRSVD